MGKNSFSCSWRGERRQVLVLVPLHVQSQMVGAGEAAATGEALEGLGTRVLPIVPGQLVRAGKAPVAAFPSAFIGLLTCREQPQVTGTPRASQTSTPQDRAGGHTADRVPFCCAQSSATKEP